MLSTVTVTEPPEAEPVLLETAMKHCRIDNAGEEILVASYLTVARLMAERYLGRALITQTVQWSIRPEGKLHPRVSFLDGPLRLPRAPIQSLTTVVATDRDGNVTTLTPASLPIVPPASILGYVADLTVTPATLFIGPSTVMEDGVTTFNRTSLEHLAITFIAGYGTDGTFVPPNIVQAILMLTAWLYENRGDAQAEMPRAVEWLLDPDRMMWV